MYQDEQHTEEQHIEEEQHNEAEQHISFWQQALGHIKLCLEGQATEGKAIGC